MHWLADLRHQISGTTPVSHLNVVDYSSTVTGHPIEIHSTQLLLVCFYMFVFWYANPDFVMSVLLV